MEAERFHSIAKALETIATGLLSRADEHACGDRKPSRAIRFASDKRSTIVPNVPTLAEGGVKDVELLGWVGIAGPAAIIVISIVVGGLIVSVMTALMSVSQIVG